MAAFIPENDEDSREISFQQQQQRSSRMNPIYGKGPIYVLMVFAPFLERSDFAFLFILFPTIFTFNFCFNFEHLGRLKYCTNGSLSH